LAASRRRDRDGLGGDARAEASPNVEAGLLATLNLVALMVHQYEEYEYPGYFPGQFNAGFHSEEPDRHPFNPNTAMIINVPLCYAF
jgi:hypothetical protein